MVGYRLRALDAGGLGALFHHRSRRLSAHESGALTRERGRISDTDQYARWQQTSAESAQEGASAVGDAVQAWWAALLDEQPSRGEAGQRPAEEEP